MMTTELMDCKLTQVPVEYPIFSDHHSCWIQVEKDKYSTSVLWANAAPMAAIALVYTANLCIPNSPCGFRDFILMTMLSSRSPC